MKVIRKKSSKARPSSTENSKKADRQIIWTLVVLIGTLAAALLQLKTPASAQVHEIGRAVAGENNSANRSPLANSTQPE